MINSEITTDPNTEFAEPLTFEEVTLKVEQFPLVEEETPTTVEDLRKTVKEINELERAASDALRCLVDTPKELDKRYPNRSDVYEKIHAIKYSALDKIGYKNLKPQEMELYLKSMFGLHGEIYYKQINGYHYFGLPMPFGDIRESDKLLHEIVQNPSKVLTVEEEKIIFEGEKNTYKVHLNVPLEKRLEVLKAILSTQKADNDIILEIFKEKEERGEEPIVNRKEAQERGVKLSTVNQYKMFTFDEESPEFPDFVFYPMATQDKTAQEVLLRMIDELKEVLRPLGLQQTDRIPRFSVPVKDTDGNIVPGISYVQGNGDFKKYLKAAGRLDLYYDRRFNWAIRVPED